VAAQNKWSNHDGASFVNFALKANSIQYENVGCLFGACKAYYVSEYFSQKTFSVKVNCTSHDKYSEC